MRGTTRQRLLQGSIAIATSAVMLGAFAGLSAAAPPGNHGQSGQSHGQSGESHGQGDSHVASRAATGGSSSDDRRPGWGCGDANHVHTGPPGGGAGFDPCTFHVVTSTRTVVTGTETKTLTVTETLTGTETTTETVTQTATTTAGT